MERGDHRAFLAALPAGVRAGLVATADGPGLRRAGGHLGAIAGLGVLIAAGVPGWWLLLVSQGVLVVFLFTALHEASHRTPFATRWMNDALAALAGFLLLLPPEWFRAYHFAHHRFTQDPLRDPELASPKPATRAALLWHCTGLPTWAGAIRVLLRNAARGAPEDFVPPRLAGRMRAEARAMLALYAALAGVSVAAGSAVLVWVWVVPALLGQPFLRVYLLAEHGRCAFVADMFENTRTTFTSRLVRWLAWNMPYHAEHHAFPAVPFHRLPALHALARGHLKVTAPGYRAFARETWTAAD
ncbi:MAG: fatty acid desaturase [Gemmobacter sp.]